MKIEQVALFGAGSVGGSLLCRQRENLDKIKVIVHGSRRERMEKEGLLTRGETFFPQIWEKGSYPDLLMVGLKNTQLKASIAELRDYVGPNTILMPLMNGISASEELREAFPENTVLTAVVYVDARKIGNELFCGETFLIQIGDAEEAVLESIKEALLSWGISCQICADITRRQWRKWMMNVGTNQVSAILGANYGQFQQKEAVLSWGISCQICADITRRQWRKWMMNVGTNQVSAILGANYGQFQQKEAVRNMALAAMAEVVAVAEAAGVDLHAADVAAAGDSVNKWSAEGKCSMLQDVEAHRLTEVESFSGKLVELGKKYGVPTPINETLYALIRAKEAMYS